MCLRSDISKVDIPSDDIAQVLIAQALIIWERVKRTYSRAGTEAHIITDIENILNATKYNAELENVLQVYNGTAPFYVAQAFALEGLFCEDDKTWFFTKRKFAEGYAQQTNSEERVRFLKELLPVEVWKDYFGTPESRNEWLQPLVLSFERKKLLGLTFDRLVDGKAEYAVKSRVPLSALTSESKQELINLFGLEKSASQYKMLL